MHPTSKVSKGYMLYYITDLSYRCEFPTETDESVNGNTSKTAKILKIKINNYLLIRSLNNLQTGLRAVYILFLLRCTPNKKR